MSSWVAHLLNSFANQAGTWFLGVVLAVLGLFSSQILEKIKFALNRATLRVKLYEEMAANISHIVFIIDRLDRITYRATWASPQDKGAIAAEYNEVMNAIFQKEYVYLSWIHQYWSKDAETAFRNCMDKIRAVDLVLINLNSAIEADANNKSFRTRNKTDGEGGRWLAELESASRDLKGAADVLLTRTI
jgi:hypothetical protein